MRNAAPYQCVHRTCRLNGNRGTSVNSSQSARSHAKNVGVPWTVKNFFLPIVFVVVVVLIIVALLLYFAGSRVALIKMSNLPFVDPFNLVRPFSAVPIGMDAPTSANDTTQDAAYWESNLNIVSGELWHQLFANHNGDWNNWLASVTSDPLLSDGRCKMMSLPLFPDGVGGSMAEAAAGAYNAHYTAFAQAMPSGLIYRLAPEFDGNWFPDSFGASNDQANYPVNFRNAWWQAYVAIKTADPTAKFCFNINVSAPNDMPNWADCFPAANENGYPVDCLGVDLYDGLASSEPNPVIRFQQDILPGIAALADFSVRIGQQSGVWLPLCVPEFGTGALGDNPEFFDQLALALSGVWVAFLCYWNFGVGAAYVGDLNDGAIPQTWARASFIENFKRPPTP